MRSITLSALMLLFFSFGLQAQESQEIPAPEAQKSNAEQPILKLEATIRGSREQPKVMSIVPWQPPTEKQPLPSPVLSRINQQFQALNRDEFRRQIDYFEKLSDK